MQVVSTIAQVRAWRRSLQGPLGLVPTMGYLHEGHLSLVRRARQENPHVAGSIFVNPTQFGPQEDLARYPRDLDRDRELLRDAGCALVFVPDAAGMYPPGHETVVDVGSVAGPLEGTRRPGHFRGVATVVLKLFGIFAPDRAYFGQKDAQQLAVIRRMVRDLDVPVEIVGCPTVREPDSLAMSSRNSYLGPEERGAAPVLYRSLLAAKVLWAKGDRDAEALRQAMRDVLAQERLAEIDYVSVADPTSFREIDGPAVTALALLAVRIGRARLIDNALLD